MLTGLSTAAGPFVHIGASSGACLIAGFVGTSTGQGTRRRGNPGETPDIKRTGPALRPGASGGLRIVTCDRRDPGFGPERSSDRTGPGNRIGIQGRCGRNAAEHPGPGARQDTADRPFGFARDDADAKALTRTAKSNPDLARGRRARVRPHASSPRSIGACFRLWIRRSAQASS